MRHQIKDSRSQPKADHQRIRRRMGVHLADMCVVLACLVFLPVGVVVSASSSREQANRIMCAANLKNIATHAFIYANQDVRGGGKFPRTYYDNTVGLDTSLKGNTSGTRSFNVHDPSIAGTNNVMSSFYLLMKSTDLTPDIFICPSGEADPEAFQKLDTQTFANWPAPYAASNSYSYNCPFPAFVAVQAGWKFDTSLSPDYPLAADINPGMRNGVGPTTVAYTDNQKVMRDANSPNHWFEGQQVAFCDGHVEWMTSPFAGVQRVTSSFKDNIYANNSGVSAMGKGGVVWGMPVDPEDAVLLPTAQDSLGTAIATRTPGNQPMDEVQKFIMMVGIATVVVVPLVLWLVLRKKRRPAGYPYGGGPPPLPPDTLPPIAGAPPRAGLRPDEPPAPPRMP